MRVMEVMEVMEECLSVYSHHLPVPVFVVAGPGLAGVGTTSYRMVAQQFVIFRLLYRGEEEFTLGLGVITIISYLAEESGPVYRM